MSESADRDPSSRAASSDHVINVYIEAVEDLLGWQLASEERAQALRMRATGRTPEAVADWFHRLEAARTSINEPNQRSDPAAAGHEFPPSRPEDNDPRRFVHPRGFRYKP